MHYGLLLGVAALALTTQVDAQTSTPVAPVAAPNAAVSDDIIITARRVNEALIDVPASITAFSAASIATKNIQRAEDFVKLTPGVSIVPWPARRLGVQAADLLLARINGDDGPARTVVTDSTADVDPP